ncbi:MAG: hypothetical protein AAGC81_01810 [Pseudomonadota bacterium]
MTENNEGLARLEASVEHLSALFQASEERRAEENKQRAADSWVVTLVSAPTITP